MILCMLLALSLGADHTFQTGLARIRIDDHGFMTSIASRKGGKEYSPKAHPSPVLSLSVDGKLIEPRSATYQRNEIKLTYPNGSIAVVRIGQQKNYLRLKLLSLSPRVDVDNIVWGPVHTTISKTIGDLIGVVRDGDWAIGMLGLDDNTIAGPPVDGDCYQMGYVIHSPDPVKYPVPGQYKEGQRFSVGGDGISDVAFYSHPEEYFQQVLGTGAVLKPSFGSTISYHSRDRRRPYTHFFSLLPGFENSKPRHQISDSVDADFIGSSVALYFCPDDDGLSVIESIILAEGLPHPMVDGKWIRDPAAQRPDIAWFGDHDKLIEYANQLGLKSVQDEALGEYYPNPADRWAGKRVGFSGGRTQSIKEFTDSTNDQGIRYGLHTLCMFIQPHSSDVKPVPNEHLQTVLRTKIANGLNTTDTAIKVANPSFLAEKGTWHGGPEGSVLRIGKEMLTYTGIEGDQLQGVKRGQYGTTAAAHEQNDELVKLQMNCYHGFVPDMTLLGEYADYYAQLMNDGGMEYVDFDGLESTIYQNQGYFAVRTFYRRLFDTYRHLSGGKYLRVMGSCVFPGSWEYMSVCNVGGGNNMFDPVLNRWGIEGKDIRNGFSNSYFPSTFGIQDYHSDWSVYDAENLQAKSIGWGATYMLGLSQEAVERSGEKSAIFTAFRTWEDARGLFSKSAKARLRDPDFKFHLERDGKRFNLYPVREIRSSDSEVVLHNPHENQALEFSLQVLTATDGVTITLPNGSVVKCPQRLEAGQFIIRKGDRTYLADKFRKPIAMLMLGATCSLPKGDSKVQIQTMGRFQLTTWIRGIGEVL